MPARRRTPLPRHAVTAVLVSHDGGRWLPGVLDALHAQNRPPQTVVAVDTGSGDGSAELLAETIGAENVVVADRTTGLAEAVQAGLSAAERPSDADCVEWIWLLHDDAEPAADALLELLQEADRSPSATVLGPKQLAPDGRQLLEVGVAIDSSGHRRTGIEPHEVDQGQHDDVRDVLAVGTAGMLVRRDVWDRLDGLDPAFPLFGDDVDFGWRATAAGERVIVVPRATVRHVAALTGGSRVPDAIPGRPGAARREHGMRVVLANTAAALVPLLVVRYLFEAALRAIALLLVRRPSAAYDEVAAVSSLVTRPGEIVAARRRRRPLQVRAHRDIRPLLPGAADRWRHVGDTTARVFAGGSRTDAGRLRRRAPVETGPVADEATSLEPPRVGLLAALVRRPAFLLFLALTAAALVADRGVLGTSLHGGRLLPPTAGASDLWSTYLAAWHPVGLGSTTPAPPWLAVLAVFATLLLGKVWLAVDVLVLGAVPLAGLTAYLGAGSVTRSVPVRIWAAVAYAFVPALTGAVSGGRLDVIVAVVLLPLLARAVVASVRAAMRRRGWHRAFASGLLLAVVSAFAPVVWVLTAVAAAAGVVVAARRVRAAAAAGVVLVVAAAVLLPWSAHVAAHPRLLVTGAGLPEPTRATHPLTVVDVLLLRPGGPGQPPTWVWAPYLLAALAGLVRARRMVTARLGWVMLATGLVAVVVVSRLHGVVAGVSDSRYWVGVPAAFAALGALVAAAVAASDARAALSRHSFGWRQPTSILLASAAAVATLVAGASWLVRGAADPLSAGQPNVLPVFAAAALAAPTGPRALVLRNDGHSVRYTLVRSADEPALGDADVAAGPTAGAAELTDAVRAAVAGLPGAAADLARFGVGLVVAPAVDATGFGGLDAVDGLTRVPTSGAVVWRVGPPAGELAVQTGATATVLHARPGGADVSVPRSSRGGRLVLVEQRNSGWTATLDGRRLRPATGGWAQAWSLPAGGGRLRVRYDDTGRHVWLIVELVLLGVALLGCVPSQRGRRGVTGR